MEELTLITDEREYVPETTKPGMPQTEEAWKKVEEERIAWEWEKAKKITEGNPGEPTTIDIRGDYDEIAYVKDGILYRKGSTIQVWWDKWGKETWAGYSENEARENFNAMKERWSSSELSNPEPGEPIGSNFHSLMLHAVAEMYGPGGIVVDEVKAKATSCECVEYKPGKFWCTSKGVVGALTDEQEKIYCNPRVMFERPGMKERMAQWAESVEICRAQLPPIDGQIRLEIYLDCMSRELTKAGVEA